MPKIVLVHPQIPPNTGNIARTCAATATELHLVGPLGFEISDRYLKRAGLDYWPHVKLSYHNDITEFLDVAKQRGGRLIGYSVRGKKDYLECEYFQDDWLLFGSETNGLPPELLAQCDLTSFIRMEEGTVRSLNLSVSVSVVLFETRRQLKK
ncbi:tRNA (cytidine(34)-2'-O)-methyltransferase [Cyanobacterium stanieri LEGE 03274]|uniref:Putative tRNA (cytidine(34)-2'-O)-methyltransferase n=1 Tax=Cyanobacterium stanieri LEGE 03274 TaxID=1828756 RepID=A0ABR9V4S2_9CHRO|nr:tRNA (cytidine(34)-2'-O)-methyltransferase [Cyanobacterium stanieri]MBE9222899.1 tRNA (cytidine(34)-2'-O)-methyltransferase [Cyanobacterium stanieri LEGE 03274]